MKMLQAVLTNDWSVFESANTPLEPLELNKLEQGIIIARMKKLAKDSAMDYPNALALVHQSYEQQEWERQGTYGDFVRPKPSDHKAWAQYEEMIQNAVQLLSKYRGIDGDWRTDRFVTVPTNDRASMGSMAAASIGEQWDLSYSGDMVLFESSSTISDIAVFMEQLESYCITNNLVLTEGNHDNTTKMFYLYNYTATLQHTINLTKIG